MFGKLLLHKAAHGGRSPSFPHCSSKSTVLIADHSSSRKRPAFEFIKEQWSGTDRIGNTASRSKAGITDVGKKAARLKWDWRVTSAECIPTGGEISSHYMDDAAQTSKWRRNETYGITWVRSLASGGIAPRTIQP